MTSRSKDDVLEGVLVVEDDERADFDDLQLPPTRTAGRRRRPLRALLLLVLVAGVGLLGYGLWKDDPRVAFVKAWYTGVVAWVQSIDFGSMKPGSATTDVGILLTEKVGKVDLRVTAIENGTLESASSVTVLSAVEGKVAVIGLVPEGSPVEKGDIVVEFESSPLRTQHTEQQIVVEKARAAYSQAVQGNLVAESQADSNINSAKLLLEFARLDLQKYVEGDFPLQRRALETETALAEEALERARVAVGFTEQLHNDGYLNKGELDADKFFETQNRYKVEMARERESLLVEYDFPRMKRTLESRISEAESSLERTKSLAAASVEQAATNLSAQEATLRLEENKLEHFGNQLDLCIMRAPQAGIVVYPVPEDEDLVDLYIKQGALVRERQHVFSIPDTDTLQVSTNIHEALVNKVKPGMSARIWIDVYPDEELLGEVTFLSPLPLPEDWRKSTVKFYETFVKVSEQGANPLRPGMSAKVEILIDQQLDTLAVPVQAVVQRGSVGLCYVMQDGAPVLRELEVGKSNTKYIAVLSGLTEGEEIVLSPDVLGIPIEKLEERVETIWDTRDALTSDTTAGEDPLIDNIVETEFEGVLLAPAGDAMAQAEFESQYQDGVFLDREFEVTVRNCPPEAELPVTVNGIFVGNVVTDVTGIGKLELSFSDGTLPADFPIGLEAGAIVTVGDEIEGTIE